MSEQSNFERLAAINVNEQVEKKGGLSYLSWAWAVDHLLRVDPEAKWSYRDREKLDDGTVLIFCEVTAFGKPRTMQLPVMDHRNKPISNPDAFQINTAMQRCLVKAIALHGLGLYIYAGEDLPPGEKVEDEPPPPVKPEERRDTARQVAVDAFEELGAETKDLMRSHAHELGKLHAKRGDCVSYLAEQNFDNEAKLALWSLLPSNVRSWIKDQEKIHRANGIGRAMRATELGSQA